MLTTSQKASILQRSGVDVPPPPASDEIGTMAKVADNSVKPQAAGANDATHARFHDGRNEGSAPKSSVGHAASEAYAAWVALIDNLFVSYAAARAAKSLRDAEEARTLGALRQMAWVGSTKIARRAQWA